MLYYFDWHPRAANGRTNLAAVWRALKLSLRHQSGVGRAEKAHLGSCLDKHRRSVRVDKCEGGKINEGRKKI